MELNEGSELTQKYYEHIKTLSNTGPANRELKVKAEYSAMWGVGCVPFKRALKTFGFSVDSVQFF